MEMYHFITLHDYSGEKTQLEVTNSLLYFILFFSFLAKRKVVCQMLSTEVKISKQFLWFQLPTHFYLIILHFTLQKQKETCNKAIT